MVDWILSACQRLKFKRQTLYLAISLFDRYTELKSPPLEHLGVLSLTALFIAYKHEEIAYLYREVLALATYQGSKVSRQAVYECELDVLVSLGWRLNYHGAMGFLDVLAQGMHLSPQAYHFAQYLVEALLFTGRAYKYQSSLVASALLYLVLRLFKQQPWSLELTTHSLYTEQDVSRAAESILGSLKGEWDRLDARTRCLNKKFSHEYYSQMSQLRDGILRHLAQ